MEHETHTEHHAEHHHTKNKFKLGTWQIATIVFAIISLILLVLLFTGKTTGSISGDTAGKQITEYLNLQTKGGVEYVSNTDKGNLYEVKVKYQNQEIPVYITKDGKYFLQSAVDLTDSNPAASQTDNSQPEPPKDLVKSAKPKVQAFIFSYCPYGLQFEKALFPVYDLLKSKADINIVAIGAMHGEYERQESLRQISIEQLYSRDKLFAYLEEFNANSELGACRGEETCSSKYLPAVYTKLGIDKSKVENYMKSNAPALYDAQVKESSGLGISGSPTFVINGVQVQVDRTAESIRAAVCSAFTTTPSECSQTLSTASPGPGFGTSSSGSAPSAGGGCGA